MSAAPAGTDARAAAVQAEAAAIREMLARRTVSLATAAAAFGIGRERLRTAVRDGTLPVLKFGREHRVASAVALRMLGLDVPPIDGVPEGPTEES